MIARFVNALRKRFDPIGHARAIGVTLGEGCRLIDVSFSTEPYLVTLGDRVSATATRFETHDGGVWVFRDTQPDLDRIAPITVGDNVFIGYGTVILPGARIGSNVVIGAGAVVSGTIPDNCVAAGVPARVIAPLDTYRARVMAQAQSTKPLSPAAKRAALRERFGAVTAR